MENAAATDSEGRESYFTYTKEDFIHSTSSEHGKDCASPMDKLFLKEWMDAKTAGAFNYSVDDVETKILPGKYSLVAQINVNRKIMRRKPETIIEIQQPVDHSKFNFTKIQDKEVLIKMKYLTSTQENGITDHTLSNYHDALRATLIVNNAPICHTHSLLVPSREQCWPQVLNYQGLTAAVHAVLLSESPDIRVAFNSLGAYASVNHLHFHIYYFPHRLFLETAACQRLAGPCFTLENYYAPGFVFQLENRNIDKLVSDVMALVNVFLMEKVAHNMFITRGTPLVTDNSCVATTYTTVRVMLWAQNFVTGAKSLDLLNTAACELAGHVPVYSLDQWEGLSEEKILSVISPVCQDKYESVLSKVTSVFTNMN